MNKHESLLIYVDIMEIYKPEHLQNSVCTYIAEKQAWTLFHVSFSCITE